MERVEQGIAIARALQKRHPEYIVCFRRQPLIDPYMLFRFCYYDKDKGREYEMCLSSSYLESWTPKEVAAYVYRILSEDLKWNRGIDVDSETTNASVPRKRG